jgi:hypothetical protein
VAERCVPVELGGSLCCSVTLAPVAPFGPQLFFCPALQLLEITSHMAAAVNEEYIARLVAGVT